LQFVKLARISLLADDGLLVVRLEGILDVVGVVDEIEDEGVLLADGGLTASRIACRIREDLPKRFDLSRARGR
jgi:hypothetical protein